MAYRLILSFAAVVFAAAANGQCLDCTANPDCTSADGFPTICPESLPAATTGEFYEETITFFMPENVVDPGSGVTASLSTVTVTSITGVPLGLSVMLDETDAVYEPANGQTAGCASICGEPVLPGVYDMVISISAVASAFGIEQVVNESFGYLLIVEEGAGGTGTFTYAPATGCDSLLAHFDAILAGNDAQLTTYAWDFGNGEFSQNQSIDSMLFAESGVYDVALQTVISDQILTQITLNSTGGGGWDDGWSPDPDPYFVLSDANGSNVYTSSTAQESYSAAWNGLSIVLTNPPYSISFYDEDFLAGDDDLGSTSFSPDGAGTIDLNANPSYAVATIALEETINVTDTATVFVNESPEVGLVWLENDSLSCTNPYLSQYNWMWGDSLLLSSEAFGFAPNENGFYTVIGTSAQGCSAASDSLLFCNSSAALGLALTTDGADDPEMLVTEAGFVEYVWSANGSVSDTLDDMESHLWFPANSGWYGVTAWDDYACPWQSDSLLVCYPLEAPSMEESTAGELSLDGAYSVYQWYNNGVILPGATDSLLILEGPGLYSVLVSDFVACPGVFSNDWTVVGIPGIEGTQSPAWSLFPNPADAVVQIGFPAAADWVLRNWNLDFYDASGKRIHSVPADLSPVDVSSLARGVYTVHLTPLDPMGYGPLFAPKRMIKR